MLLTLPFLAAVVTTLCLTPVVRVWARATGRVARPTQDRWHSRVTALFGGIAIFGGFIAGVVTAFLQIDGFRSAELVGLADRPGSGIVLAATLMFVTGVIDDLVKLRPTSKLVLQALAGALLVTLGATFALTPWAPLNIVFTLFWFIALTNAVNLLDNMDGVATGVAGVGALFLTALLALEGQWPLAAIGAALVGATLGFLPYNFRPASIFMGDSGSLFLGSLLAGLGAAYSGTSPSGWIGAVVVPTLVVIVPILDTSLVTFTRTMARYAITQGGRDHVAHRLVSMGFSESRVALLLYLLTACGGLFALLIRWDVGGVGRWLCAVFVMALVAFGAYLSRLYVYPPEGARPMGRLSILLEDLLYKRRALEVLFDLVVFAIAYSGAYLLRYDGSLPPSQAELLTSTLAMVVACKSVAFAAMGAYRGVWNQISIADVHRLVKASVLGILLTVAAVVFVYREMEFSRSIFILDGILVLLLPIAVRASFRSFEMMRYSLHGVAGVRALIYGAGKGGELLLREIHSNPALGLNPVGLIDDDSSKVRRLIHGFPVLGTGMELQDIIREYRIQKIVLGTKKLPDVQLARVQDACRVLGVELLQLEFALQPVELPVLVPAKKQSA